MSKNIKAVPTTEYDAVIAVAQKYIDGLRNGSSDEVAQAFHKDAVMYGFTTYLTSSIRTAKPLTSPHDWMYWRLPRPQPWYALIWKKTPSAPTITIT